MRIGLVAFFLVGCQVGTAVPEREAPVAPAGLAVAPLELAVAAPVPPAHDVAPPFTLTASDGSGLQLVRVDAKAVLEGPLAYTELHLYFHNPESRTREGTFAITLPSGAAVSRFAMESDGTWLEAEVVEKALARRAYDDFLHRRQDPALLEKAAGNQFTARVFPIPAQADKHLVVSFSQELAGQGYTLPLRGLPEVGRVDVAFAATGLDGARHEQSLSQHAWQPDRDFVAQVPAVAAAVTAGSLVVGSFVVAPRGAALADPPKELTLLVDTSASRALGFADYVAAVHGLVDTLRARYGNPALEVIAFDQDTQLIFDGLAESYGAAQDAALVARGAAGASDLAQAIAALAKPRRRVVVVTDGVMTAGPETPALVAAIRKLPVDRLDVVLAGGIRDEHLAAAIARAGLPHAGDVFDLDRGAADVAAGLGDAVRVDVPIEIPGATWVYPRTVPAARPGSALMVFARMARPTRSIDLAIGGDRRTLGLGTAAPALVERAVASAEIDELETRLEAASLDADQMRLRDDIAKRSVRARVISSQTSMLVLESDADYDRYHIDRTALADILVVGPKGLEQTHRTVLASKPPAPSHGLAERQGDLARADRETRNAGIHIERSAQADDPAAGISSGFDDTTVYYDVLSSNETNEEQGGFGFGRAGFGPGGGGTGEGTIGTGHYGTIGHGSGTASGYGIGGGRGGVRGRTAAVPSVAIGQPVASGDLDRAIIRRYIRRNIQKISYCYERELLAHPTLQGTLTTRFTISPEGTVPTASGSGFDTTVTSCVVGVIKTIEFPKPPGSATIQVTYPFTFRPSGPGVTDPSEHTPPPPPPAPSDDQEDRGGPPLTGKLADVMKAIASKQADKALALARPWHDSAPGDVLALVALGETLEAKKDLAGAARIYGSIIDLFPMRADFRRFAGERLERVGIARALAIDTYRKAVADRPDHLTGHRLLAYALLRAGDHAGAFAAILAGVDQKYPPGRYLGGDRVLAEDAGMIAAAYLAHGGKRDDVLAQLQQRKLALAEHPSTRFILYWETDANDVDFHIRDHRGGHAWYQNMHLPSGGDLYADITTGYGPECFAIQGTPSAGPYKLSINYFSQGPMGYGMGLLQIQRFDGKDLAFDDRPYVIMTDHAFVDLGTFDR